MHGEVMKWVSKSIRGAFRGEQEIGVLELGCLDMNGSPREAVAEILGSQGHKISFWIGVDASAGKGVDVVALAHTVGADVVPEAPRLILCLEMLEHDPHWEQTIRNAADLLAEGGHFVATWASPDRDVHELDRSPTPGFYNKGLSIDVVEPVIAAAFGPAAWKTICLARDNLDVQCHVVKPTAQDLGRWEEKQAAARARAGGA